MMRNKTCRISVSGLVQGIGFRPFVAELAESLALTGQVKNLGGIVEIIISGDVQTVDVFIHRLRFVGEYAGGDLQWKSDETGYVSENTFSAMSKETGCMKLPGCRIDSLEVEILEDGMKDDGIKDDEKHVIGWNGKFHDFHIVESGTGQEVRRFLPVDLPTCDRCIEEMHDKKNRRYRYPFISCTSCGPRFSIQKAVPYDRETITMDDFPMCEACREEYTKKGNIRRHAQTIACKDCGPRLRFIAKRELFGDLKIMDAVEDAVCKRDFVIENVTGNMRENMQDFLQISDDQQAISEAVQALKNDKIGAIKDIGGYHFACSPLSSRAAARLREFKHRDKKPFAVMFLNLDEVREYCEVSEKEAAILTSSARPIVLLKKKKDFVFEICGESDRIGALLPCNPLQILLLEETGPLVMTSGNRGGEPIIISESEMQQHIGNGIDFMLTHDREILTPLDDSIYQVTELTDADICVGEAFFDNTINGLTDFDKSAKPESLDNSSYQALAVSAGESGKKKYAVQLIRRARGLAPEPIVLNRALSKDTFAAGGDLKAVFGLGRNELVYLSQYFGDLEDVRCMESREHGRKRMEQLLEIHPEMTVGDLHPAYISTQDMQKKIQHHHAHAASVIAEHGLEGKVLGIACDGTGYGKDGTIWGSEFLVCEDGNMSRAGHFSSVKLIGGDASAKQAELTLYSYMLEARERGYDVEAFFLECEEACVDAQGNPDEAAKQKLRLQEMAWKQNINAVRSSSMGRLFDAAAALLEICEGNSYEGECAIALEQAAHRGKCAISLEQAAYKSKCQIDGSLVKENRDYYDDKKIFTEADDVHFEKECVHIRCAKISDIWQADSVKLLVDLYHLKQKYSKEVLAYLFHHAAAEAVIEIADMICMEQNVNKIVLSGGTFINRILLQEVVNGLAEKGREVYMNEKVPCGDGGIALGQMYLATF